MASRPRILFMAEAATLAQVVRLRVLAAALDPARYDVSFACDGYPDFIFAGTDFRKYSLRSVPAQTVLDRTERGGRPYTEAELAAYVEEDLTLIDTVRPDLIVGDLRWSLGVSAPHRKIPLASLINAYWHPAHGARYPLPDHPTVRWFGKHVAGLFFPLARPLAFRHVARPVNRLRRRFGLSSIGSLPDLLCHGDHLLFPDVPELVPLKRTVPHARYLGPVAWSPEGNPPDWWNTLPADRPLIYVTLGSSGPARALPRLLESLARLPVRAIVSTAGRPLAASCPDNVHQAAYLPGELAARRARLVVCNGGATTAYQALGAGKPVLGIPSNLDQYLSMTAIERSGAGMLMRAEESARRLPDAIDRILSSEGYARAAADLGAAFRARDAREEFRRFITTELG